MKNQETRFLVSATVLLAAATFAFAVQAAPADRTFERANAAFASGNYQAAIGQYESIIAHDGYSAPVLFNLGNAFYRAGQFGSAILNYERARVLEPRDPAIAANLLLACGKAGVPAPAPNEAQKLADVLNPNTLAWIGSITLMAICLATGLGRCFPRFTQGKSIMGVAAATLLFVVATFAIRWPEFDRAIAVAANAPARIAPAGTAAGLFALKPGESVTVVKKYGQFALIRTTDGRSGWENEKSIERIFN